MNSPSSSELSSELDLSSIGSLSPPPDFPTPPPSQETISPAGERISKKRSLENDDLPTTKRRKTAEPKPRTTQHLRLGSSPDSLAPGQKAQLDTLLKVLRKRQKIVVIAGAGISVSAGIPDFRSDTGLFISLREEHNLKASGKHLFDASVYQMDASTSSFHDMVRGLSEQATAAEPTEFHHMLAKLANDGRLMRLYTQNIDGIDTSMPPLQTKVPLSSKGPWPRTVQLHGGLEKMNCLKCHNIFDFQPDLFNGAEAPPCTHCIETDKIRTDHAGKRSHGIGRLRPRIVLYNEHNPDQEAIGAVMNADLRTRPDAVIVVGTSMKIPGVRRYVRELCSVVRDRKDGLAVWINRDPPPVHKDFENCWDLVVEGDCDQVAAHANLKHWDDTSIDYQECTESEAERAKMKNSEVKVMIQPQVKKAVVSALLTPAPSPRSRSAELEEHRKKILLDSKLLKTASIFNSKVSSKKTAKPESNKKTSNARALKPQSKATGMKPKKSAGTAAVKSKKAPKTSLPNIKINQAFKVTKHQAPKAGKPKSILLSEDELSPRAMAPISPSAARNNGPVWREYPIKSSYPDRRLSFTSNTRPSIENIHLPVTLNRDLPSKVQHEQLYPMVRIELDNNYFEFGRGQRMGTPLVLASEIDERTKKKAVGRLKRLSEEIVSPTSMPGGMRDLLN